MNAFSHIVMFVATIAFIGVGIYTIVGGWHMIGAADFGSGRRPTRREMMARIPPQIRKLGMISISVFLGCLVVLTIASLIFR